MSLTKKELEARIAVLEAQVALLLSKPSFPMGPVGPSLPRPSDVAWPKTFPMIWNTSPSAPYTINVNSVDDALAALKKLEQ